MKKLIAGNWKMNLHGADVDRLCREIREKVVDEIFGNVTYLVCVPYIYIERVVENFLSVPVLVGAQDCSVQDNGAYTGEISATMVKDSGCRYVILGHSERRKYHAETDKLVRHKATKAHEVGLTPIICVGETEEEREQGKENTVVMKQIEESLPDTATAENIVIAYEPVWAIGTGKTATPEDVEAMHGHIRNLLKARFGEGAESVPVLYGGSMKPDNAKDLLHTPNVDGGLIGGASLKSEDYIAIAHCAEND